MESSARQARDIPFAAEISLVSGQSTRAYGKDKAGNLWFQFQVDFLYGVPATCALCGKELHEGWVDTCSGLEYCLEHVLITESAR